MFLVWNSINDPLFGWISDRKLIYTKRNDVPYGQSNDIILKRIRALSSSGPLFAISFLLFWFHILPVTFQFLLALCLYDGFLTMVELHHQSLLADLTINAGQRAEINAYCSFCNALGSISVFISFALWNKDETHAFQLFCLFLTVIVIAGFHICCTSLRFHYEHVENKGSLYRPSAIDHQINNGIENLSMRTYIWQVLHHENFLWFAAMNLLQVFHCHFNSNFFPLFLEQLLGHVLTPRTGAALLALSFLVPHLNNLWFLRLCRRHGVYRVIHILFYVKLLLAVIMCCVGAQYEFLLCIFIASNRVFTEGTCKLLNLVISDLVDEDFVRHRRKTTVSALVFGTSALLSKPGQSLAPLLGSCMLYLETGKSLFSTGTGSQSHGHVPFQLAVEESHVLRSGCFNVLVYVPIFLRATSDSHLAVLYFTWK